LFKMSIQKANRQFIYQPREKSTSAPAKLAKRERCEANLSRQGFIFKSLRCFDH